MKIITVIIIIITIIKIIIYKKKRKNSNNNNNNDHNNNNHDNNNNNNKNNNNNEDNNGNNNAVKIILARLIPAVFSHAACIRGCAVRRERSQHLYNELQRAETATVQATKVAAARSPPRIPGAASFYADCTTEKKKQKSTTKTHAVV